MSLRPRLRGVQRERDLLVRDIAIDTDLVLSRLDLVDVDVGQTCRRIVALCWFTGRKDATLRRSTANAMNGRPPASTDGFTCVMRTRRSRGGMRARENLLRLAS